MSDKPPEDLEQFIRERFDSKKEILEALANIDNILANDAETILELLDEEDQD